MKCLVCCLCVLAWFAVQAVPCQAGWPSGVPSYQYQPQPVVPGRVVYQYHHGFPPATFAPFNPYGGGYYYYRSERRVERQCDCRRDKNDQQQAAPAQQVPYTNTVIAPVIVLPTRDGEKIFYNPMTHTQMSSGASGTRSRSSEDYDARERRIAELEKQVFGDDQQSDE